jgi:hypothetical protein
VPMRAGAGPEFFLIPPAAEGRIVQPVGRIEMDLPGDIHFAGSRDPGSSNFGGL